MFTEGLGHFISPPPLQYILRSQEFCFYGVVLRGGPFGYRFHPVLPADFTELLECKGLCLALKKFPLWGASSV